METSLCSSTFTTLHSKLRCFQYKNVHNILYLNQKLFLFWKHNTSLCPFCNLEDETVIHLAIHSSKNKRIWHTVIDYFKINLHIPPLSPQRAIFGFLEGDDNIFFILNQFLLLLRYYIYVSRSSKTPWKSMMKVCTLKKSDEWKKKLFPE